MMRELLRPQCCCKDNEVLRIPYGNPFRLCICRDMVAPGNPSDVTFADIDNLSVKLTRFITDTSVEFEVMENGDLLIDVPAAIQKRTTYGILMTGTYQGNPWRWKASRAFTLVSYNAASNVGGFETFGVETYWLGDSILAYVEDNDEYGQTLYVETHGQATIEDDELKINAYGVFLADNELQIKNEIEVWQ